MNIFCQIDFLSGRVKSFLMKIIKSVSDIHLHFNMMGRQLKACMTDSFHPGKTLLIFPKVTLDWMQLDGIEIKPILPEFEVVFNRAIKHPVCTPVVKLEPTLLRHSRLF